MEKASSSNPKVTTLSCGEWYCENFVRHVSGLKMYKCVSWKVCMRLSRIIGGNVQ